MTIITKKRNVEKSETEENVKNKKTKATDQVNVHIRNPTGTTRQILVGAALCYEGGE